MYKYWNQNLKARKVTKNKHKNNAVLNENEKRQIKIDIMSVTWPLNSCILILHINTCEHYNNFMTKYISITYLLS